MIKKLEVVHKTPFRSKFSRRRKIRYSSEEHFDFRLSDSAIERVKTGLIYQKKIPASEFRKIPFRMQYVDRPLNIGMAANIHPADVFIVMGLQDRVFVKKQGSDYYEYVHDAKVYVYSVVPTIRGYLKINFPDGTTVSDEDEIYVRLNERETDPQTNEDKRARELWVGAEGTAAENRLGLVVGDLIHGIYPEPVMAMEGTISGLLWPRTVINFRVQNKVEQWVVARAEMNLNENESRVLLIEKKFKKITDYEQAGT